MANQFTLLPRISPFLPEIVRALLDTSPQPMTPPWSLQFEGAVVRVLIDGFTGLVETFAERESDGERLMNQAVESYFGERVEVVHAYGGSTVLLDGHGMVLLFPSSASPEARFLAGRAALGACLLMRGQAGPGRARPGSRGPSIESRMGVSFGEVTLGAAGTRAWHILVAGPGLDGADAAALQAQSGEVMATDSLLGWVGTVRTEGTFHRGMASITALPPPDDRLEPTAAGLRSGGDELAKRIMAAIAPEARSWAEAGDAAYPSHLEPASVLHVGLDGLGILGEAKAVEKLHIVVERTANLVEELGGQIEAAVLEDTQSWMYLSFGGTGTEEGRLRAALHAALELRRALRLPFIKGLRLGLASGTVFRTALGGPSRRHLAILGPPVEEASRLAALSVPGQILVDPESRERAGGLFEFEVHTVRTTAAGQKAREHMKRTQSREVQVLVRSLDPLRRAFTETPMVGRAVELALCESALLEAVAGRGSAFTLHGTRGSGRTTLLRELSSRAKGLGVSVIRIDCQPHSGPFDLTPLRDLLARLRGEEPAPPARSATTATAISIASPASPIGPGGAGGNQPGHAFAALPAAPPGTPATPGTPAEQPDPRELARDLATELRLSVEHGPMLLVLEDLDRASPLARSLARKVGSLMSSLPIVLILSELPGTPVADGPEVIELTGLTPEEIEELAVHITDGRPLSAEVYQALAETTGGHPLHIAEALRALDLLPVDEQTPEALRSMPSDLHGLVSWRMDRLDPALRKTLELAASLELPAPLDALRAIHPEPARISEHLAKLAARGFPIPLSGQSAVTYNFAEPLHAEVVRAVSAGQAVQDSPSS